MEVVNVEIPQAKTIQWKEQGEAGPYSKKTLAFALVSCIIGGIALSVSVFITYVRFVISSYPSPPPSNFPVIDPFLLTTVLIIVRIVGLIFGVIAKIDGNRAIEYEPENGVQQVGNVFSYIGIIINGIFLVFAAPLLRLIF